MNIIFRKLRQPPRKILLSRTDRIGDFILTLPVLEAINRFPRIDVTLLCRDCVVPLLKNNPYCKQVISIRDGQTPQKTLRAIRENQFDCLLVLVNDPIVRELLPGLKHIPVRIGPMNKIWVLPHYTHPIIQKRSKSTKNEAEYNLEMLRIFDTQINLNIRPKLYLTEVDIQEIEYTFPRIFHSPKPKVALHAGMSGSALNWPVYRYQKLIEELLERDITVVLTGAGPEENMANENFIENVRHTHSGHIFNLAEQVNLRQLASLISRCDLFIGPSTGPTHIANAVQTPIVTIYPPIKVQSSIRWEPYLANAAVFVPAVSCNQKYRCREEVCSDYCCMDRISVDSILRKAEALLKSHRIGSTQSPSC